MQEKDEIGEDGIPDIEHMRSLIDGIQTSEDKYVYFLLAVAAAAIAYGMERTSSAALNLADVLLGVAFTCWALSFWSGCRNRQGRMKEAEASFWAQGLKLALKADMVTNPNNPHLSEAKAYVDKFAMDIDNDGAKASLSAQVHFAIQFKLLVAGAAFYVLWHIVGMAMRTPGIVDVFSRT